MMFSSRAVYHGSTLVELFTPYNEYFVDTLKAQVPAAYRRWNPDTKTWMVQGPYDTTAIRVLRQFFSSAEIDEKPGSRPIFTQRSGCSCDAAHKALYVCQDAPLDVVKAVYRVLAKKNHPDAGGDQERMRAINSAYERITGGVRS